jgi:hypothetical protein
VFFGPRAPSGGGCSGVGRPSRSPPPQRGRDRERGLRGVVQDIGDKEGDMTSVTGGNPRRRITGSTLRRTVRPG